MGSAETLNAIALILSRRLFGRYVVRPRGTGTAASFLLRRSPPMLMEYSKILSLIDAEISLLQAARAVLAAPTGLPEPEIQPEPVPAVAASAPEVPPGKKQRVPGTSRSPENSPPARPKPSPVERRALDNVLPIGPVVVAPRAVTTIPVPPVERMPDGPAVSAEGTLESLLRDMADARAAGRMSA